jgi:monoamine oxidase
MPDVIVIGAGAAGLAAAERLYRNGADVLVLEARDRLGGRIFTVHGDGDAPTELGAEFVHGRPPAMMDFIQRHQLALIEFVDRRSLSRGGRVEPLDDFWDIVKQVDEQIDPRTDVSYQQFLQAAEASRFAKEIARSYIEGFNAARCDVIGTSAIALAERAAAAIEGDRQFRFREGYHQLVETLAGKIPPDRIVTGEVVREVSWREGAVEVHAGDGKGTQRYRAPRLIVTVPHGVLRAGTLRFQPDLPAKRTALEKIEMGHVVKITMRFREPFWMEKLPSHHDQLGFSLCLDAPFPTWWGQHPMDQHVLTGWAGGTAAERILHCHGEKILELAFVSISNTFGVYRKEVEALLVHWRSHDWSADPFSRGAYSYPAVGGLEAARVAAQPIARTLFFAGEATDTRGFNGTVHGAMDSGCRAADEVLAVS